VAIPTAIPAPPFRRSTGTLAGRTLGSYSLPSKLGRNSTVSELISSRRVSEAILDSRHSV